MSITQKLSERAKYTYLLQLCREQIRVIGEGDMIALDRVMLAKKALIESLVDAQGLMLRDPSVVPVINQIKAAEIESQDLLQTRIASVKRKLTDLGRQKGARSAYRRFPAATNQRFAFTVDSYTPRYIDCAS